jgi:integrase
VQRERKLGLAWEDKSAPPPGYLRPKDADAQLQELLVAARRGAAEQRRTGMTSAVVAEQWLAWGVRDRDWKPSTAR